MRNIIKLKSYTIVSFLAAFLFLGCDFLDTDTQKIVGHLYVNYAQSASKGYVLVIMDGSGINYNISEDYIQTINGDDTILLIEAIDRNDASLSRFYTLKHNNGQKPFSLKGVSKGEYRKKLESIKDKYNFHADAAARGRWLRNNWNKTSEKCSAMLLNAKPLFNQFSLSAAVCKQ